MTIVYKLANKLYLNITNQCSCDCLFCIRQNQNGVGDATSLWLLHEPTLEEINVAVAKALPVNLDVDEIVFCGYGEPMIRADVVIAVTEYIRNLASLYEKPALLVRVNTNGLVFLMHPGFDVKTLSIVDTVSISLNADDAKEYARVARPVYGEEAFGALLDFVQAAKAYTKVVLSVVEGTLSDARLANCKKIAEGLDVPLRLRPAE